MGFPGLPVQQARLLAQNLQICGALLPTRSLVSEERALAALCPYGSELGKSVANDCLV